MRKRYLILGMSMLLALALAVPALGGPSNPVASISANAKKTAKKALKKAKAAQQTADQAQNSANQAQNSAEGAQTAAEGAQTTADGATAAAGAAQTAADAAQATANSKFGDIVQRSGPGSGSSSDDKGDVAACQTGEQATGGGFTSGGAGSNDVTPVFDAAYGDDGWITNLAEIGAGTAESWSVTALVQCTQPE